ncbi:hypothetical protein N9933_00010 [bacterium]|nr:hypothetical protein [bacterium]
MLIIISDLHLSDGTSGKTISPNAFRIFRERVRDMAYEASWRTNGDGIRYYKPIEKIDIILLGDILDIIRSRKWIDENHNIRPWDSPQDQQYQELVLQINRDILSENTESLGILRQMSQPQPHNKGAITLPRANARKLPARVGVKDDAKGRLRIPVNLHYMVGNHDWFYHLPGEAYNQLRKEVVDACGLANDPKKPFAHEIEECPVLQEICLSHRVYVRHGDIFDKFNFDKKKGRDAATLGDAIVIELLNRFPLEVRIKLGDRLPKACAEGLNELDNVRPLPFIPLWINGLLNRTCQDEEIREEIKDIWNELARKFVKLPFVRQYDTLSPLDKFDKLEIGLYITRKLSFKTIGKLINLVQGNPDATDTYLEQALKEPAWDNEDVKFVVYGHTHHAEMAPIDSSDTRHQIYFNSGTWRQVHEITRARRRDQKFYGFQVMTYIGFFKEGERKGRHFEFWSGALGE